MSSRNRLIAAVLAAVCSLGGALVAAAPARADDPVTVPGSAPVWLARATRVGTPAAGDTVTAVIDLAPRGGTGALDAFIAGVSDPDSGAYRKFLTREEYAARFAPADTAVSAVSVFLKAAGFTDVRFVADSSTVRATGTVAQANRAFDAALGRFTHDGLTVTAPSHALRVPARVAQVIAGVRGLDTTGLRMKPLATDLPPSPGYRNSSLCSTTYGTKPATAQANGRALPKFQGRTLPYSVCGYTGAQLRKAYEKGSALTGKGVDVAVVDAYASPTIVSDIKTYASRNGDPAYAAGQFRQFGPTGYDMTGPDDCDAQGWFGEETLDIEAVHAMAPGADIRYYAGRNCDDGLYTALVNAVNDPEVDIVTNSYGTATELAGGTSGYESLFRKAAAIGVTVLFSSGDSGDSKDAVGFTTVGYPASSPNVTAVGGTATAIGADGSVTATNGWGTEKADLAADGASWGAPAFQYGAGGGASRVFAKPSYQRSISGTGRQVPDLAMDADPTTGMRIGQTQTFSTGVAYGEYRIGGTSLASPLVAGFTALAVQKNGSIGFVNPTIYARTGALTDVTDAFPDSGNVRGDFTNGEDGADGYTYSVRTFGDDSSLPVKRGYDTVTGLGVPNLAYLSVFG